MNKKTISLLFGLLTLILSTFLISPNQQILNKEINIEPPKEIVVSTNSARVVTVIDGDTIEIETKPSFAKASEGREKVRYIGIDAPESQGSRKTFQCFAKESLEENKKLVEGKVVVLEKDVSEKDKYGRLLRYVYLPQEAKQTTSSGLLVNDFLVRQGYARTSSYPPDVKYQSQLNSAQKEARENLRGLWNSCE